jgi:hypothetical protein
MLYDTKKHISDTESKSMITKSDVLEIVSEYDIFRKYIGDIRVGQTIKSPLREDSNPSFGIFVSNRDNALLYKDLANGDCGDAFKFVKNLFGLRKYSEVMSQIISDFNVGYKMSNKPSSKYTFVSRKKQISVKRKAMTAQDLAFWAEFGISEKTLSTYRVNAISLYSVDGEIKATYTKEDPIYSYKVFDKFKIYRPLGKKINKWRGNLSSLDIMGYEQLPEGGDVLIITKSLKDVMVLHELGYNAISPPSESTMIPEIVLNKLKERFKKIVIFYDRDRTGVQFTRKIVSKYSFDFLFINKKYKTKDISDFAKKFSLKEAELFMKSKISIQ